MISNNTNTLCLLCTVKNEEKVLEEFIEHYADEGFDGFFFIDNGSTDKTVDVIFETAKRQPKVSFEVKSMPEPNRQIKNQNQIFQDIKTKWMFLAIVDCDEYMYSVDPRQTTKEVLVRLFEDTSLNSIQVPWFCFGSSGLIQQPKSIRKSFTMCKKQPKWYETFWKKSIMRCSHTKRVDVHESRVSGKTMSTEDSRKYLLINHYKIMSRDYFFNIKMARGDACLQKWNSLRDESFFSKFDQADEEDLVLQKRVLCKEQDMCSSI